MKSEEIKTFKVEFEGAEIETIKSAVKKIHTETQQAGFKKLADLSGDEIKLIDELNKKLNG